MSNISTLADIYGSSHAQQPMLATGAVTPQVIRSAPYASIQRGDVAAPPASAPAQQMSAPRPAPGAGISQVQSGQSPQQLTVMQAVQQQIARQAAAAAAARAATVGGQTQGMIDSRGVFGGGQAAAPAASRPNTQLPPLQTTGGIAPRGGV